MARKSKTSEVSLIGVALLFLCLSGEAIHVANTIKHTRAFSSLLNGAARRSGTGNEADEFLEMNDEPEK